MLLLIIWVSCSRLRYRAKMIQDGQDGKGKGVNEINGDSLFNRLHKCECALHTIAIFCRCPLGDTVGHDVSHYYAGEKEEGRNKIATYSHQQRKDCRAWLELADERVDHFDRVAEEEEVHDRLNHRDRCQRDQHCEARVVAGTFGIVDCGNATVTQ